jgi:hypothetical protein
LKINTRLVPVLLVGLFAPIAALAHVAERGFILLLPTEYYLIGGTAAVAATFAVMALVRPARLAGWFGARLSIPVPETPRLDGALGALGFAAFLFLIYCGVEGARDPLTNPLPLTVWTLGWVGLTLVIALVGDLWAVLNPWRFPVRLIRRAAGVDPLGPGPVTLPEGAKVWPAIVLFLGIAWFELVDIAPADPDRLAIAVSVYWLIGLIGCLVFGEEAWRRSGEPLSILFRYLALLAPITVTKQDAGPRALILTWPGGRVLDAAAPSARIALFLLLTLATVSFDGLKLTFWYLDLIGVNPLEFPGRSAVADVNSFGLVGAWIALASLYFACVILGERLAGRRGGWGAAGLLVLSILPISLAYHFSHYLTVLLVNGQWAVVAFNDPLVTGADLLGAADFRVTTSFLNVREDVETIWDAQVAAIVYGHVLAVLLAHALMARREDRTPILSQFPLGALMIGYTLFGLWLLASPTGG